MTRVNLYDLSDRHIAAFDLEAPKPPGSIRWGDRVFVRSKAGLYQESACVLIEHPAPLQVQKQSNPTTQKEEFRPSTLIETGDIS